MPCDGVAVMRTKAPEIKGGALASELALATLKQWLTNQKIDARVDTLWGGNVVTGSGYTVTAANGEIRVLRSFGDITQAEKIGAYLRTLAGKMAQIQMVQALRNRGAVESVQAAANGSVVLNLNI